jgi:transglutaminase-like putative cysteine protease
MSEAPVTLQRLAWAVGCLMLAVLANLEAVPVWVLVATLLAGGLRLGLASLGRGAPPKALTLLAAAVAIGLLLLRFHTLNGITAGTSLLCLMAGLKLLETTLTRDLRVIVIIVYFLALAALLHSESFWLLTYLIGVCWLATATLMQLTVAEPGPGWRGALRGAGRLLLQALPLALFLWLLFPRLTEPLWAVGEDSGAATTGLSDTMDPGDISELVLSEDIAFRVRFAGPVPQPRELYWRGPVLEDFTGRVWRRSDRLRTGGDPDAPAAVTPPAYTYTIGLEPYHQHWIYALDRPVRWDLPHARLSDTGVLERSDPVSQPLDVTMTSVASAQIAAPLSAWQRRRALELPPRSNPRTTALARQLRSEHPEPQQFVAAVLDMLHTGAYFYTLTPPRLGNDPVDDFLFDSKRGFCGHYASAFAVLMRAAGIPARIVTGYLGGRENPYGKYWIVRQSNAHAWVEVWIEGNGWLRIDPTAAIASERVETQQRADSTGAILGVTLRGRSSWLADIALRIDALRQIWRERILEFDQSAQQSLLQRLDIPVPDAGKLALLVGIAISGVFGWLGWQVRRDLGPLSRDPLARAYAGLCRRLARAAYAERIAAARPDLAAAIRALLRRYSDLRYASAAPDRAQARALARDLRAFRAPLQR